LFGFIWPDEKTAQVYEIEADDKEGEDNEPGYASAENNHLTYYPGQGEKIADDEPGEAARPSFVGSGYGKPHDDCDQDENGHLTFEVRSVEMANRGHDLLDDSPDDRSGGKRHYGTHYVLKQGSPPVSF
jgi:hypothetical protein